MKNTVIVVLLIAVVALGGVVITTNRNAKQAEAQQTLLKKELDDARARLTEHDQNAVALREKLEAAQVESAANAGTAAKLTVALTNTVTAAAETNTKPANPFAEMFKNPETRDMIKQQQKTVMSGIIDKNYADFFKAMNLNPEQQAAMKELLMNKTLAGVDLGMDMISGDLTPERRAELTKQMKEANDAINQQLKDLLGAENYSQFEAYEKSVPDRQAIDTFKSQLGADAQLTATQEEQLRQALSAERQDFKFTTDFGNQQDYSEDMFTRFTEERINLYVQEQERLNQKLLARAQAILSPTQYETYAKALKSQQETITMSMKMAASMFGTKK